MKQSAITNAVHHSHNSDIKTFLDLPGREENKKKTRNHPARSWFASSRCSFPWFIYWAIPFGSTLFYLHTYFFFAGLPASHCSLPGRWWLFSPVVIGFFSTRLCSTGKSTDYSFFAGCVWPRCCCGCCCTVFDRAGPVCAYANRFECLLKI